MNKQKRRKYTEEYKQEAVNLVIEQGYRISEAARNLGINDNLLRRWVKERTGDNETSAASNKLTAEQEEIRRLTKEVERLKMEREILKKATAFFAKESR